VEREIKNKGPMVIQVEGHRRGGANGEGKDKRNRGAVYRKKYKKNMRVQGLDNSTSKKKKKGGGKKS